MNLTGGPSSPTRHGAEEQQAAQGGGGGPHAGRRRRVCCPDGGGAGSGAGVRDCAVPAGAVPVRPFSIMTSRARASRKDLFGSR